MDIYKSNTAAQLQRTRREFNTLKLDGNESITDYIARALTLRARLEASSQKIDDKTVIITILDGLPSGYSAISTFIENTATMPSLSEVQGMLSGGTLNTWCGVVVNSISRGLEFEPG